MSTPINTALTWHSQPQSEPLVNDWLFNQDSLTQRLIQLSQNSFSVLPLNEGWQRLRADECAALGCPEQSIGWVREVFLRGKQQPWVYARSVASQASLQESDFDLACLGTRSLGELLFSDQAFERGVIEICQLTPKILPDTLLPFTSDASTLWARRSCFSKEPLKILVAEAFLPAFWQHLATHKH